MRPSTISVSLKSIDTMKWVMAHRSEAHTLAITIYGMDPQAWESLGEVLTPHLWGDGRVRSMAVHIQQKDELHGDIWLWLLFTVLQPESLCLSWDKHCLIPAMDSLRHLRLEVKSPSEINWSHLARQPNLESLKICSDVSSDERSPQIPKVDLSSATKLHRVTFQLLVPSRLSVPPECEVHIVSYQGHTVSGPWMKGLRDTCKSCEVFEEMQGVPVCTRSQPSMLRSLRLMTGVLSPKLTVLKVDCKRLGSEKDPFVLGDTLPRLETLEVTAKGKISLSFGTGVRLRVLSTLAGSALCLNFKDIAAFTKRLERFSYKFKRCSEKTRQCVEQLLHKTNPVAFSTAKGSCGFEAEQCHEECACGVCVDCTRRVYMPSSENAMFPFVGLFV